MTGHPLKETFWLCNSSQLKLRTAGTVPLYQTKRRFKFLRCGHPIISLHHIVPQQKQVQLRPAHCRVIFNSPSAFISFSRPLKRLPEPEGLSFSSVLQAIILAFEAVFLYNFDQGAFIPEKTFHQSGNLSTDQCSSMAAATSAATLSASTFKGSPVWPTATGAITGTVPAASNNRISVVFTDSIFPL